MVNKDQLEEIKLFFQMTGSYWKALPLWERALFAFAVTINTIVVVGIARGW
jgi:hypothetical protein